MITHEQLLAHLCETGFRVEQPKETTTQALHFYHNGEPITLQLWSAAHKARGVRVRWIVCQDDSRKDQLRCQTQAPHIHYETSVRTAAGGLKNVTSFYTWQPPSLLADLDKLQGHAGPAIGKDNLPEPYRFGEQRFHVNRTPHGLTCRCSLTISFCRVAGVVGLRKDARIDERAAATPNEEPWFHLDCRGTQGATFDIITNGEVWYPLDRKSKRVTINLRPKPSVDLSEMGQLDKELVLHAIHHYVDGLG